MNAIDLFCGKKSVAKAFKRRGHITFTLDIDPQFNPDWAIDVLKIDVDELKKRLKAKGIDQVDVFWASVPCTTYSVASLYRYWKNGKPSHSKTFIGLAMLAKTLEIIEALQPTYFFIENPRGMMRKQEIIQHLPRKTVTYCQYGHPTQKPTDIFTNAGEWIPRPTCSSGDSCHETAKRGDDKGTQSNTRDPIERAILPDQLCDEIVDVCEGKQKIRQEKLESVTIES